MNKPPRRKNIRKHQSIWLDLAVKGSVAIAFILALGCGVTDGEDPTDPTDPNACVTGEQKPAADGCNTCTCDENGNWNCPRTACPTQCSSGDTSDDGCNTCACDENGRWICTQRYCEPEAKLGEACSMHGTKCEQGLECAYQCPDPNADPNSCNLGINPSGTCVATTPVVGACTSDADCVTDGCSGQLCRAASDAPIFTTCDYRPEYACYKAPTTACGCNSGVCGWAQTAALAQCLGGATR